MSASCSLLSKIVIEGIVFTSLARGYLDNEIFLCNKWCFLGNSVPIQISNFIENTI